jgi:hypothetical protein
MDRRNGVDYRTVCLLDTSFLSKNKHQFGPTSFTFAVTDHKFHSQNVTMAQHAFT